MTAELVQLLNVAYGNVSLMEGARLTDLILSPQLLKSMPGPRFGIGGVRAITGARKRSLVSAAIKPMGLSSVRLARLAAAFARAGVDVVRPRVGGPAAASFLGADRCLCVARPRSGPDLHRLREVRAANSAFDIAPGRLVSGLVTERGLCRAESGALGKMFGTEDTEAAPEGL